MPTKALCDLEYITMGTSRSIIHIKTLHFCNTFKQSPLLLRINMSRMKLTSLRGLSCKKQAALVILAVILSALAGVAKACGSGWSTVPHLIAATPH